MPVIEVENLTYIYSEGTSYERKSLDNVSLTVNRGDVLGILGENGSGKSTLIKHFNGLLHPTSGRVTVLGKNTSVKQDRNELWKSVGMVFQFPEQQLFEDTVFNEIAFGLKNLGISKEEIPGRVKSSLQMVGMDSESFEKLPPICLSGGLRRRVALASVLAMDPEILVMDEPTAGLDAFGRKYITELVKKIKEEKTSTIIIVSHNISEMVSICSHLAVLDQGKMVSFGETREVLSCKSNEALQYSLLPDYIQLVHRLSKYSDKINTRISTYEEAEIEIDKFMRERLK